MEKGFVGLRAPVFILIDAYPPEPSYYVLNMHLSYGAAFYCFLSVTIPVTRQTSFISHYTHYTQTHTIIVHHTCGFHSSPLLFTFRHRVRHGTYNLRANVLSKFLEYIFWKYGKKVKKRKTEILKLKRKTNVKFGTHIFSITNIFNKNILCYCNLYICSWLHFE